MNHSLRKTAGLLAASLLALMSPSCSGQKQVYPVHGKVLDANQQPAVGALVVFHSVEKEDPDEVKPVGTVDETGAFTLTTYKEGDGAPAGEYYITLSWIPPRKTKLDPPGTDLLGGRYAKPKESPVPRFKVEKAASNEVPVIQLK